MTVILCALLLSGTLTSAERDSLLADTPGNQDMWTEAFDNLTGDELWCAGYLFGSIPRLTGLR